MTTETTETPESEPEPIALTPEEPMRRRKKANQPRLMDSGTSPKDYPPGTHVVIYVRVSMAEQLEGYSLAAQERACREFAARRGWIVVAIYADPGHSGKNDKRPGFQELVAGARARQFKILLVHKLDRFSRSIEVTLRYFRELNENDVTLASVSEEFDYTTPMGRMFFRMMAVFAQWYLENLSAETVKGKEQRALTGLHNGRMSFGYHKVAGTKVAQQLPEAAEAVSEIFKMYRTGKFSDGEIADYLNERNFMTYHKHKWSKDSVRTLLQNEFYYGMISYRNHLLQGHHIPIITKEEFDEAQAIRAERARRPKSFAEKPKRYYFLQRIACCDKCGRSLRMQGASGHYYYKEMSRERGMECEHSGKSIRTELADEQVLGILRALRLPQDWQAEIEKRLKDADAGQQIEKRRQQLKETIRRLGRAYLNGSIDDETHDQKVRAAQDELGRLVMPSADDLTEVGMQIEKLTEFLGEASAAERSEIVHLLLESVSFDLEQGQVTRIKPNKPLQFLFAIVADELEWKDDGHGALKVPKPKKDGLQKLK